MKIAVLDDYQDVARRSADWSRVGGEVVVFEDRASGRALVERLRPFDVVCLMRERTPMPAEVIEALPNLKLIVTTGRRNASIDLAAAARRGIPVSGTESHKPPPAHLAMTLILAASRGLAREALSMRDGGWQRGLGRDVHGLTLGLIGLGRLGAHVAALARPFGMRIVAWSRSLTDERAAAAGAARMPSLRALLAESDVVSIHAVLSPDSRGLIDADALAAMKPDALLVNTSRGPIVDWRALLDGLRAGRPGAAALDVYDEEPLPADHPLRDAALIDAGKLLLVPHIGYVVEQTYRLFYRQTVEAVEAWRAGRPVRLLAGS